MNGMTQIIEVGAGTQMKDALHFFQHLQEDHAFRESVMEMKSTGSLEHFITGNGFSFDKYDLIEAFIEYMELFAVHSGDSDRSLYEKGLLEIL